MHEHKTCKHELKYCEKCDVVYCEKCKKEWFVNGIITQTEKLDSTGDYIPRPFPFSTTGVHICI